MRRLAALTLTAALAAPLLATPATASTTRADTAIAHAVWDQLFTHLGLPRFDVVISAHAGPLTDWGWFRARPRDLRVPFQSGYGFVRRERGRWIVVADGSALVGCPLPGVAARYVVPGALRHAAHALCPPPSA